MGRWTQTTLCQRESSTSKPPTTFIRVMNWTTRLLTAMKSITSRSVFQLEARIRSLLETSWMKRMMSPWTLSAIIMLVLTTTMSLMLTVSPCYPWGTIYDWQLDMHFRFKRFSPRSRRHCTFKVGSLRPSYCPGPGSSHRTASDTNTSNHLFQESLQYLPFSRIRNSLYQGVKPQAAGENCEDYCLTDIASRYI